MRAFTFFDLPVIAVANGATTPAPTYASQCFGWSSTLARPVVWDGAAWQRLATYGETLRNTTDTLTGNLTVTGLFSAAGGAAFGDVVYVNPATGTAALLLARTSLSTGQVTLNFSGGTGSSNWQIFQQSGTSDLAFYSSVGGYVAQFFTDGHAQFFSRVEGITAATASNDTSFATTAFVKAQAYLTAAPVTSVFGRTGAVSLTSADVTGALAFTPINRAGDTAISGALSSAAQYKSTVSGGGVASAFLASAAGPGYAWNATGGAADSKLWDVIAGVATWTLRLVNDANSAATNVMTATRSGMAVASIAFGAPTSIAGALTCANLAAGDITASRGDGTGALYLGGPTRYLYSSGTIYQLVGADLYVNGVLNSSDVRFKRDLRPVEDITDKLMTIEAFTFAREDSDERHIGVSAQSVQQYFPEAVRTDAEGRLSVAYAPLALAGLVEYVRYNDRNYHNVTAEIRALSRRLDRLVSGSKD